MYKKTVSGIMLILLLTGLFSLAINVKPAKSAWTGTVYIRADGSIEPSDAPIITYDNITYTLTSDIVSPADGIVVERDNIIIDGAGYTLQGTGEYPYKGVDLYGRSNITIKNTIITTFWQGILLYYSSNNSIVGNNITNNWHGIMLYIPSYYNSIVGNNIANNDDGILLYYSSNNSIVGNNITANNDYGILLDYSSNYNSIVGNNIANNRHGIMLYDSSNNSIFHNNFIDNTGQASLDRSYGNVWDDGYPSGGNYWSDYVGVDLYSGPHQNETGSDGIGDTPYVIDENNRDRYPLMNPWGSGPPVASFSWSPSTPEVGELVIFDASASLPVGGEIISYEWDFGDGSYASGKIVTQSFGSAGTFTVTLNVTDSEGLWDIEQKQIEVKAPPPPLTVAISPTSASILEGQSVTFTSTVSGGYSPYTYQWYLNGVPVSGATSETWAFIPTEAGTYYIYLKVTDNNGNTAQSETARITVAPVTVGGHVAPIVPIQLLTTAKPLTLSPYLFVAILMALVIKRKKVKTRWAS